MVKTEILSVIPRVSEPAHSKSEVDYPLVGTVRGTTVRFAGWFVLAGSFKNIRVEVILKEFNNKVIAATDAAERLDVVQAIELDPEQSVFGYEAVVNRYDLPPVFSIVVWAFLSSDEGCEEGIILCEVNGCSTSEISAGEFSIRPIYVVGLGRSGTTVLMRTLSKHPSIVCGDKYPLELCISSYHAKIVRITTSSAAPNLFAMPQIFSTPFAGPNPFASIGLVPQSSLEHILEQVHDANVEFARKANDIWYRELADAQGKGSPILFVEKSVPNLTLVNALNYYSDAAILLLVRDPIDIFLSRARFNRRRGYKDFGEQVAGSYKDWALAQANECRLLKAIHECYSDRVLDVIKYEQLTHNASTVLQTLCGHLGVQSGADIIERMTEPTSLDNEEHQRHRTSSADWDEELSAMPIVREVFAAELADFLRKYGYS